MQQLIITRIISEAAGLIFFQTIGRSFFKNGNYKNGILYEYIGLSVREIQSHICPMLIENSKCIIKDKNK